MKLTRINYNSAVIFGIFSFILYLIVGILKWNMRNELMVRGIYISALKVFVENPVMSGIGMYLFVLIGIIIYNFVSIKYPISWTIKK